jgi:transaldolase
MELFLDSASADDLKRFIKWGIIDGVTTNQKIFLQEKGVDFKSRIIELCELAKNKPVSVESNGNTVEEIVKDAKIFTSIASNVVAKVPMTADGVGLESVAILSKDNIPTNVTAMMNLNQLMLATKAGATYVSLFFNRARDAGEDPVKIIKQYVSWTEKNNFKSKLIVGSIRKPFDVEEVASAGAHIITITPNIMEQLPYHAKTEETLKEFDDAWKEFTSSQN